MNAASHPAPEFRRIAATIRNNPNDRQAIADGFDLIAEIMEPCVDCGAPLPSIGDLPSPVIDPKDLPDVGADTTGQAA